jgi:hypothetical protein
LPRSAPGQLEHPERDVDPPLAPRSPRNP